MADYHARNGSIGGQIHRNRAITSYQANPTICSLCKQPIPLKGRKPSTCRSMKFCNHSCSARQRNLSHPKPLQGACAVCNATISAKNKYCKPCRNSNATQLRLRTKSEAGRRTIAEDARYATRDREQRCAICNYGVFVDTAHITAVKDFPGTALLIEINAPSNLVLLCPNHHREFDRGLIALPDHIAAGGNDPPTLPL